VLWQIIVVSLDSWPSQSAMTEMSAPECSKAIAALWRSVCGVTCLAWRDVQVAAVVVAFLATRRSTASVLSGLPWREGNRGSSGVPRRSVSQARSAVTVWLVSGGDPVLSSSAVAADVRAASQVNVADLGAGQFRDAKPGLPGQREQRVVAAAVPGGLVGRGQERVHFVAGEVAHDGAVGAFGGDRQDTLPWTEHIVLTEYSPANIDWLSDNLADALGEWAWQPFWDLVAGLPGYGSVEQPRRRLATCHGIHRLSIFDLPRHTWDLGSMFFVADGITSDKAEFESAVRSFVNALTPRAPFMMAFMEGSSGYNVSGISFPAVEVTLKSLSALLAGLPVTGTKILRTDNSARRVRPGYDAMLLATGYVVDDGLLVRSSRR
jgi:hypothetical protein